MQVYTVYNSMILNNVIGSKINIIIFSDFVSRINPDAFPELIKDCGAFVQEPFGYLEKIYKKDYAEPGKKCFWMLRAPDDQVIHINMIMYNLEDDILMNNHTSSQPITSISFYDGTETEDKDLIFRVNLSKQVENDTLTHNLSPHNTMTVVIDYHHDENLASQSILIKYEFVKVTDILESTTGYESPKM
ncbi:hypothetical protein QAD02_009924 [Eretmocerus hayati]|uniref:Uncharacterized protein n=1 Tax=Eretmocerus hayati TaxID=131215 RepID=A0ACC2NC27_9HYME|nr:hypothetical protein QAD02_009924 [Eretmocerus hayati]